MTHVCAGHACDDCNICRFGICCATLSAEQRVQLEAALSGSPSTALAALVVEQASQSPSLAELVRRDAARLSPAVRLPAPAPPMRSLPPAPAESIPLPSRKEALDVPARPLP